ncbi:MAG TPA: HAD-IA family hydrolase [Caulobacteraceae bacterium]|jgi:phosphoglycolate phosphatase
MPLTDAVIAFDLDGTVVDTAPDLIAALNAMLEEEGLPPAPVASARHLVGHGARALLRRGFELAQRPWDLGREEAMVDRFVAVYRDRIVQESRPFPGVLDALDALQAQGARFVICTNKRTDLSVALLDGLGLTTRFEGVIGPDLAPAAKPDARHLLTAIAAARGDPARALMVGDSETDLNAARNAGVPCVLVSFGYCSVPLADLAPDALIDDYAELPAVAERLLAAG